MNLEFPYARMLAALDYEIVQHISIYEYIAVSGTLENRVLEYVDHLHEHFVDPVKMQDGRYTPPTAPGYSI